MKSLLSVLLSNVLVLLLIGCAKELPDHKSDSIERDVRTVAIFSSTMTGVSTGEENAGTLAIQADDGLVDLFALNETKLRKIELKSGPTELGPFFEDLYLPSKFPGEEFIFKMKLTKEYLVVYRQIENTNELSAMERGTESSNLVPVFQYKINDYGTLDYQENQRGDRNNVVVFHSRGKDQATHVKISPSIERRTYAGLREKAPEKSKAYLVRKNLEKQILTKDQLINLFDSQSNIASLLRSENLYKFVAVDYVDTAKTSLFINIAVSKNELNVYELELLKSGDLRFQTCSHDIAINANIEASECVLKPIMKVDASNIKLEKKLQDTGEPTALVNIIENVPASESSMVKVNLQKQLSLLDFNINSDIRNIDIFSQTVTVKTTGSSERDLSKLGGLAQFAARAQTKFQNIEVVSSPPELLAFVDDLKIPSNETGEIREIVFRLYRNNMVAFLKARENQVDDYMKSLLIDGNLLPLYQVSISGWGVYKRKEVALGQAAAEATFEVEDKVNASHVRVSELVEHRSRNYAHMDIFETKSLIVLKDKLDGTVLNEEELRKMFKDQDRIDLLKLNLLSPLYQVRVLDNNMFITVPVSMDQLNNDEVSLINIGDNRIVQCSPEVAMASGISTDECYLKPVLALVGSFITPEVELDADGNPTAQTSFETDQSTDGKNLVVFDFDQKLYELELNFNGVSNELMAYQINNTFDLDAEYIYVPKTMGAPRSLVEGTPFYQGNEQIVQLKFEDGKLLVYEKEIDERFRENELNNHPVLEIPGRLLKFECKDNLKDCSKGLKEKDVYSWQDADTFIPDFKNVNLLELNTLDIWNVEGDRCLRRSGEPKLVHTDIDPKSGVINFEIERTYSKEQYFSCIWRDFFQDTTSWTGLTASSFKMRFFYSIIKLDTLATRSYEKVEYPVPDHSTFGFFKTYRKRFNDNFDRERYEEEYLMKRFAAKNGEVVYYMSDEFNEEGQEHIKAATYKAFESMNKALEKAEVDFKLVLKEPAGIKAGDLRFNIIQLVTDPIDSGLLGYGPTVGNPHTGEILQGHISMFSGVLRSLNRRIWQNMVDLSVEAKQEKRNIQVEISPDHIINQDVLDGHFGHNAGHDHGDHSEFKLEKFPNINLKMPKAIPTEALSESNIAHIEQTIKGMKKQSQVDLTYEAFYEKYHGKKEEVELAASFMEDKIHVYAKNNAYLVDAFPIGGTVKMLFSGITQTEFPEAFKEDGTLKNWDDLSADSKKKASIIIETNTYTHTLIHEMGHNLGLRHNFEGSFDKANFYSEEEAKELGMRTAPAYSSIMDYGYSSLNELETFGKYDIAALRFAYKREAELTNGEFVKVEGSLDQMEEQGLEFKEYRFCTDQHARLNATCDRFDEGTSRVEIAKALIKRYEDGYKYYNYRDGRKNFSTYGIFNYTIRKLWRFGAIRNLFEDWERYRDLFTELGYDGETLMTQGCPPNDTSDFCVNTINDIRDMAQIVGDFFVDTIIEPDHLCAVRATKDDQGNEIPVANREMTTQKLFDVYRDVRFQNKYYIPKSCFDAPIAAKLAEDGFEVMGEAGRFVNSFKDFDPNYPYANDLAVKGVWPDKMMAMKYLFQRRHHKGTKDDGMMALVDHPYVAPKVANLLSHLVTKSELETNVSFVNQEGSKFKVPYDIDFTYKTDNIEDVYWFLARYLGISIDGDTYLNQALLNFARRNGLTKDSTYGMISRDALNNFAVKRVDSFDVFSSGDGVSSVQIDNVNYLANSDSMFTFEIVSTLNILPTLDATPRERLLEIFNHRVRPPMPEGLTPEQQALYQVQTGILVQLADIKAAGSGVNPAYFIQNYGQVLGQQIIDAYNNATPESLLEVVKIKEDAALAPEGTSENDLKVFNADLAVLAKYLDGQITEDVIDHYTRIIPLLPEYIEVDSILSNF